MSAAEPVRAVTGPSTRPRPGEDHVAARPSLDDLLDLAGLARPAWMVDAACRGRDPRVFFPGRSGAARLLLVEARAICSTCPVREPCADHAIASGEKFGVWGGLSEKQRRVERRRRRQEPAPP